MGCDIHLYVEKKVNDKWEAVYGDTNKYNKHCLMWLYNNRNYSLFAFLADVRNDGSIEPLAQPRGLPNDLSNEIRQECGDYNNHSYSWFTLKELLNVDLNKIIAIKRVTGKDQYEKLIKNYEIPTWDCKYSNSDNDIEVEWKELLGNIINDFYQQLARLLNIKEETRIVFWFDN